MKSTEKQLQQRGFASNTFIDTYRDLPHDALIKLLKNGNPSERTAAVKIISTLRIKSSLQLFCSLLFREKKLYTIIALSEAIIEYGEEALPLLIPLLGEIGNNQHREPALIDLNKKSYPLPRDLAARIIIRIGVPSLKCLRETMSSGKRKHISEAIDALGHICFNHNTDFHPEILISLYKKYCESDDLLTWKLIRSFQSFPGTEVTLLLKCIVNNSNNQILIKEAKRSLNRIEKQLNESSN